MCKLSLYINYLNNIYLLVVIILQSLNEWIDNQEVIFDKVVSIFNFVNSLPLGQKGEKIADNVFLVLCQILLVDFIMIA